MLSSRSLSLSYTRAVIGQTNIVGTLLSRQKASTTTPMSDIATRNTHKRSSKLILRGISVFKFSKALMLFVLGIGLIKLLNPAFEHRITHWVGSFAWSYDRGIVLSGLHKITGMTPAHMKELGVGAFLYGMLFAVEGAGLWLGKKWAEYLTLLATASLLPFELYELSRKASITRVVVLVLNLIIVLYLARLVRRRTT